MADNKIGEAYVELRADQKPLDRGLAKAKGDVTAWSAGVSSVAANAISLGGMMVASQGVNAFKASIVGAADLGETMSKVGVVFGPAQEKVTKFADEMAAKFGLGKQVMLDAASSIGLVGKAAGLTQSDAAGMSIALAQAAADASSFYNVPLEEALLAIKSALVGESEPIRKFGVLLNEDAVKAEAFSLGLAKVGGALTEQAKVMARVSLIQKGMSDSQGDLARTSDSFTNKLREIKGRITSIGTSIGEAILPAATVAALAINGIAWAIESLIGKIKELIDWWNGAAEAAAAASEASADATGWTNGDGGSSWGGAAATGQNPAEKAKAINDKAMANVISDKESKAIADRVAAIQEEQRLEAVKEKNRRFEIEILKQRRLDAWIVKEKGPDGKVREVAAEANRPEVDRIKSKYATPEGLLSAGKDKVGQVLGLLSQMKGDALGGVAIAANKLLGGDNKRAEALTGVTDFESYRRAAQDSILEKKDETPKKQLEEAEKQTSELKAIKDGLIGQGKGLAKAVFG